MARIYHVKKAQKDHGTCEVCREPIKAGQSYKWWKPGRGRGRPGYGKRKRHEGCKTWTRAEMTSSPLYSALYGFEDDWELATTSQEDAAQSVRDFADFVREELAPIRLEAAENMEDGFGHETYQSQELREQGEELEAWADEIESAADEIDSLNAEDYKRPCDYCGGAAEVEEECAECDGYGNVKVDGEEEECPECGGEGNTYETCYECDGEGEVEDDTAWQEMFEEIESIAEVVQNCPV